MNHNTKIISKILSIKKKGVKIGLLHGVFDLIHSGHIEYFRDAKRFCNILVVSVTTDKYVNKGIGRPHFKIQQRIKNLQEIKLINFIIENDDETPINLIKKLKPNYYIKGKDYQKEEGDITGNISKEMKAIKSVGGKFVTTNSPLFSSTKILNKEFGLIDDDLKKIINVINKNKILKEIKNVHTKKINKKILIIGEQIIDKYTYVQPTGKSAKNNIIASRYLNKEEFGGGTILVANIFEKFINKVDLVTFDSPYNNNLLNKTLSKKVRRINIKDKTARITIKNRFLDFYSEKILHQVNNNDIWKLSSNSQLKLNKVIKDSYKKYDAIVYFNFGLGLFSEKTIKLINLKTSKNYINCQSNSSNFGFNLVNKFKKGKCVCMDSSEFRLNFQDRFSEIKKIILKNLKIISGFKTYIITLGKNGCFIINNRKIYFLPTININPKDTTGSGDVFFSIFIIFSILKKLNYTEIGVLSHLAAGIHASFTGNQNNLNPALLFRSFENLSKN
jgi:rfaE bifunctional protein nucleotidyltransferase chain/domain